MQACLNLIIVLGIFELGKGNSTFLSSDKSLTEVLTELQDIIIRLAVVRLNNRLPSAAKPYTF